MVCLDSHSMGLECQYLVVFVSWLYLPSYLSDNFTTMFVSPLMSWVLLIFQSNELLTSLHVTLCWGAFITSWYQALPLVTCRVNSWHKIFITIACLSLWLTRKRLLLVANSWFHIPVTLSLTYSNCFQNITVDGWDVYWTQWNNFLSIIL